jgi:transmembrane sensor
LIGPSDGMEVNDELIFRVLTGRADLVEAGAVRAWRGRSIENETHYLEVARVLSLATRADDELAPSPAPRFGEMLAAREISSRPGKPASPGRYMRPVESRWSSIRRTSVGLATAAILVVTVAGLARLMGGIPSDGQFVAGESHEFVTGPNETANVVLGDGTVIRLGSDSRLRVPNGTATREVSITGRAYFSVVRDESRPFIVRTPAGAVRVLGTRFSLEAQGEDLQLVVVEGSVSLRAQREEIELGAKQMARVIRGNSLPVTTVADPAAVTDWVGDFLAFQDTPLRDVLKEIEGKYNVSIELSEESLGERTLTAWFAGYTLEQVMEVVCIVANSSCEVGATLVTMRPQL